ncbi:hypothetical protein [Jatrophihabitans lederbergiae]|uniref:DUF1918 domain-containing protein n=1 Tax=Jatrophihabitans lederbergiae TaxID=3075547 RepID=A0ABU2JBC9_9ACTN|nr:hypothetical protein [Jatrophihabitans sp. DSM 44399]MDT0262293.1 hypothetical protein [Jatrophihabitans sp. DSM 44399]
MNATQNTIKPSYQVGSRVLVQHKGTTSTGQISSIHRQSNGTEYVVRIDACDGGMGSVLNLWSTSDRPMSMRPAPMPEGGAAR